MLLKQSLAVETVPVPDDPNARTEVGLVRDCMVIICMHVTVDDHERTLLLTLQTVRVISTLQFGLPYIVFSTCSMTVLQ